MIWRWIIDPAEPAQPPGLPGARNMAIDSALLASVAEGAAPAIRLYRWSPACLSFGRNQVARGEYHADRARQLGLDIVRRPTGGLAVLHDAELTYAVAAPVKLLGGPRRAYRRIHETIAAGLAGCGIETDLAGPPPAGAVVPGAEAPACFAAPAGGEVLTRGRKLVGSAQRTERRTFLQHGSILLEGSQTRVDALRTGGAAADEERGDASISVAEAIGGVPPIAELAAALRHAFAETLAVEFLAAPLDPREQVLADEREEMYRDDAWTWRR